MSAPSSSHCTALHDDQISSPCVQITICFETIQFMSHLCLHCDDPDRDRDRDRVRDRVSNEDVIVIVTYGVTAHESIQVITMHYT